MRNIKTMTDKLNRKVCRTCLKQISSGEKLLPVYDISHIIMSYTTVKIKENDGLPSNICNSCHKKAYQAFDFKVLCEESEQKLRSTLTDFGKSVHGDFAVKEEIENSRFNIDHGAADVWKPVDISFAEPLNIKDERFPENCVDDKNISFAEPLNIKDERFPENCVDDKKEINSYRSNKDVDKRYKCHFCDMCFIQKKRYLKHEKKHEDGITCHLCGKTFLTIKHLQSHISIHNRRGKHLCQTCGKHFTMPENLIRHQRIHSGVRPYVCKICERSFTQSNELKSHMITHSSEKIHLCNVCGNKYARHMSLQIHIRRIHSDASILRPYRCETCGRTFKDKRDLAQHNSIHNGEKKHICKVCSKAFNRASNLKVHERIHFGPRPFVCHICQRSFIQKHVLNTHLRTHPLGEEQL